MVIHPSMHDGLYLNGEKIPQVFNTPTEACKAVREYILPDGGNGSRTGGKTKHSVNGKKSWIPIYS
jgi:hypothetical protein